jgi:L-ascorbate metabolism protein UlaG (beta-lactamase superfamily)
VTRSSRAVGGEPAAAGTRRIGLRYIGHATVLIEIGGVRVLTDPFLGARLGPLERHGPLPSPDELEVDVVVISHGHADHFDATSLKRLPGDPIVVAPRGLGMSVWRTTGRDAVEIEDGEVVQHAGLRIIAVPAEHWITIGAPRAQPIGYVLDAGPRVYFAGDTARFDGLASWVSPVDLALLPVWTWGPHVGPGHLGPRAAALVLRDILPRAAVPIHWGTLYPRHLHRVWHRPLREPGDRFAEHAARLVPSVDVRVLRPGESTTFDLDAMDGRVEPGEPSDPLEHDADEHERGGGEKRDDPHAIGEDGAERPQQSDKHQGQGDNDRASRGREVRSLHRSDPG